jgi:hypothetical protein
MKNNSKCPRCIAKTLDNKRCKNNGIHGMNNVVVCNTHFNKIKESINKTNVNKSNKLNQSGGGFEFLPICMDVLSCNWTKNISYMLPGLNHLISMVKL